MVLVTRQRAKAAPRDGRRSDDKSKERENLLWSIWRSLWFMCGPNWWDTPRHRICCPRFVPVGTCSAEEALRRVPFVTVPTRRRRSLTDSSSCSVPFLGCCVVNKIVTALTNMRWQQTTTKGEGGKKDWKELQDIRIFEMVFHGKNFTSWSGVYLAYTLKAWTL